MSNNDDTTKSNLPATSPTTPADDAERRERVGYMKSIMQVHTLVIDHVEFEAAKAELMAFVDRVHLDPDRLSEAVRETMHVMLEEHPQAVVVAMRMLARGAEEVLTQYGVSAKTLGFVKRELEKVIPETQDEIKDKLRPLLVELLATEKDEG